MKIFCSLFLFFLIQQGAVAQVDLERGLLSHWPLDGNAQELTVNRNGQIVGSVVPAPDRFGQAAKALDFSGAGSYIIVADNGSLNVDTFSISLWFKTTSSDLQTLFGKSQNTTVPVNDQVQISINRPEAPGINSLLVPDRNPCTTIQSSTASKVFSGSNLCLQRWYHMVVTFEGTVHKLYVDGILKASRSTGFSRITSCNGNYLFGAWRSGDFQYFKGSMDDIRIYNRVLNDAEISTLGGAEAGNQIYDYSYTQSTCDLLDVKFAYNGPGTNIDWLFESGKQGIGRTPVHRFSKEGEFPVTMIVKYGSCETKDTLVKPVNLNSLKKDLIISGDTTVCAGSKITLLSNVTGEFCWVSNPFLLNPGSQNPEIQPLRDTTYYLNKKQNGPNLVKNGDFSKGNVDFFTTYNFRSNNTTEGEYFIGPNPSSWNGALTNCRQPSGTAGNMMLVNGVPETNKIVWQQEIAVDTGKTYDFSLFITAMFPVNPAILQFAINGIIIGDSIQANSTPCNWRKFNAIWNSGKNKKATISIVNRNIQVQGNDFALDDIEFRELFYESDSVIVRVASPDIAISSDTSVCLGSELTLSVTGLTNVTWTPSVGLNNPNISNPVATIAGSIQYIIKGTSALGCEIVDSVKIEAISKPKGMVNPRTVTACSNQPVTLSASGGIRYSWSPAQNLSNPFSPNPTAITDTSTYFKVRIEDDNGCFVSDSVFVNIQKQADFKIFPGAATLCDGDSLEVRASGGNRYLWQSTQGVSLSVDSVFSFKATTSLDGLQVKIWNDQCLDSTILSLPFKVNPKPVITLTKSNNFDCYTPTSQLTVSGGTSYQWDSVPGISNTTLSNPLVTGSGAAIYVVRAINTFGCFSKDSILVDFINNGKLSIAGPSQACRGTSISFSATGATAYSWSPTTGLSNPAIANPVASIQNSITYKLVGITTAGCTVEDSLKVNAFIPAPIEVMPKGLTLCKEESVQLSATGGIAYSWTPALNLSNSSIGNPVARINTAIGYRVDVTDSNGCLSTDSIFIDRREKVPFQISPGALEVCRGALASFTASGGNRFKWTTIENNQNQTNSSISFATGTSQSVSVQVWDDLCRDSAILSAGIKVNPLPKVILSKSNDLDCNNTSAQLTASGGVSYSWLPTSGLNNPNISNPIVQASTPTRYRVVVTDSNGCTAADSITINFQNIGNVAFYLFPNAFTPNGDGLNDCFGIGKWGNGVQVELFQIYNRWGQLVFSGDSIRNCWDGVFKGQLQPGGNYIYVFKGSTSCGFIDRKGSFMLLR